MAVARLRARDGSPGLGAQLRRMVSLAETAGCWSRFVGSQVDRARAAHDGNIDARNLLIDLQPALDRLREPTRESAYVTGDWSLHARFTDQTVS